MNRPSRFGLSLMGRASVASAVVMAIAALLLIVTPIEIDAPVTTDQLALILAGAGFLFLVNVFLLRRVLGPLEHLTEVIARIDPAQPGQRLEVPRGATEVAALSRAFNQMLDRLERERRESARIALAAQERERQRLASELHDEIGQSLTAAAIQIEHAAERGQRSGDHLHHVAGAVRESLDDVRRIARELRPEALDDLGLINALIALCNRVSEQGKLRIDRRLSPLPQLDPELELVIYRVAQESLTNVVRHARASDVIVTLAARNGQAVLSVEDDGQGLPGAIPTATAGISGMRERARLADGALTIESSPGRGTTVRLEVPLTKAEDASPA